MSERSSALLERLLTLARNPLSREADEPEYYDLFVDFEILFAINSKGLLVGTLPAPDEIERLRDDYISGWDAYIDKLQPKPDFKIKRRRHILRTFNRLVKLCKQA